jgi:branched-chain amino acid transport system substrate-binding protein
MPAGAATPERVIRVGIVLPLGGDELATTGPIRDGALLALASADIPGVRIEPVVLDHAVNGVHDAQDAADDLASLVADPTVLAVIGPYNSSVGKVLIPISNEAGLLLCSPSNTTPELTLGPGAAALRAAHADRIAYVRTLATDDLQAPAMARFARERLGLDRIAIVDDGDIYGTVVADQLAVAFMRDGGVITGRSSAPVGMADLPAVVAAIAAGEPQAVYFGGLPGTGAAALRAAMADAGLGDLPFLVAEGANDGPADTPGTFLAALGDRAGEVWTTEAAPHDFPGKESLAAAFGAAYGTDPSAYAVTAYVCGQAIAAAIGAAGDGADRESVRALVTDPARTVDTALGPLSFDQNGDTRQRWVSFYRVDPTIDADPATPGTGAWTFVDQLAVGDQG